MTFSPWVTVSFQKKKGVWKFVSIRLLPFNYQCVSQGMKCLSSDLLSCGLALCSVITVLLGGGAALQGRLVEGKEKGRLQGEDRYVCVYVCVCVGLSGECCCLLTWPSIRQGPIHPSPTSPTQGPSARLSARPGISTLISHLWRPNELRLLLHL